MIVDTLADNPMIVDTLADNPMIVDTLALDLKKLQSCTFHFHRFSIIQKNLIMY
jgi:hypothetical protein